MLNTEWQGAPGAPLDYAANDVPPEEDHDEPYSSGLWGGVLLTGAFVMLVLAAFAIKEMMTWLL